MVSATSTRMAGAVSIGPDQCARAPEELLAAHPALMKRPLIEAGGEMYLGWTAGVREALGVS